MFKPLTLTNRAVCCTDISRLGCGVSGFTGSSLVCFQAGGTSVGWALGYMLTLSNMVPEERLGRVKALPIGPWSGILFLFIAILLIVLGYLLMMIYRNSKTKEGMV